MSPTTTTEAIGLGPIELGSMLFTLVEPHRGHEVAYNRWYERDHFYAGCMIGAYNFAGKRWVATRDLKDLRFVGDGEVADDPLVGSFLSLYWVLAGHHQEWNRWAYRQLKELHADDRMFPHRDHVHTLLYTHDWAHYRDDDPVPASLALDHPYASLAVVVGEASEDAGRDGVDRWEREELLPSVMGPGSDVAMCLSFSPMPLLVDAPGVAKDEGSERRYIRLYFCESEPATVWRDAFADLPAATEKAGVGRVLWGGPFRPAIPGTDSYTDRLW